MAPGTEVRPDPRAYVRIAGMLREMIHSQVLPPARLPRALPGCAVSMAMPGRRAEGRCACWRAKVCYAASPASATTSTDPYVETTPGSPEPFRQLDDPYGGTWPLECYHCSFGPK